ncbi:MAG: GntR family transcriptional regulator [Terriglobales bacterium]|jgi:DNA-binding GntR family transcriptional regulator
MKIEELQMAGDVERTVAPTRSDDVYERLREAILTGRARPNERLIEAELADRLQVSRTPIRESLQRLAAEGLVVSRRRGWVVLEHTSVEIREIYEARAALEGYCARLAAQRATDAQLKEIASLHHPKRNLKSSRQHLVEINDGFHDAILAAAQNERLADMIRRNRTYYFTFRIAQLYSDEEADASIAGHQAIVRALLQRDANRAEREMRAHIDLALAVILAKLR